MKKIFILAFSVMSLLASAQKINEIIYYNRTGDFKINLQIEEYSVILNSMGKVVSIQQGFPSINPLENPYPYSITSINDSTFDYDDNGSFGSSNALRDIEYYNNFYSYKEGKLEKVKNIKFDYNSDFYDYLKGKPSSIGEIKFEYYGDFYNYEKGKIKSIGPINFSYHNDFYPNKKGKLASIKGNKNNIRITVIND